MNVLDRWPARIDYQLEVVDTAFHSSRQPRQMRILPYREIEPPLRGPFIRGFWKLYFAVDIAVHAIGVGRRNVMLDNDFGLGIQLLDTSDELNRVARIFLGRSRRADHERELRNDPELPDACGQFQRLLGRDAFVHLPQHLVGSRFGAEEDHRRAALPNLSQGLVGITQKSVHAPFGPPAQPQPRYGFGLFPGMSLVQKKIVVVKLNGIDLIVPLERRQHRSGTLRRLCFLPPVENRHYAAELASIRASDAGLMNRCPPPQKRRQQIPLNG